MKYSVIIPAYNEEASIAHCLEALTKQTIAEPFEVIVVDNRSTDATSAIARKFATKLNLRVLYEKKQGRGAARATGFAAAKGDFLFSTDADAMVPPEWMESFVEFFMEHPDAAAVTSTATIDSCTPMQNAMFNALLPYCIDCDRLLLGHPGLFGFSFAITKQAYEAAGGFSPDDDAYEDLVLASKVSKNGGDVYMIREPKVLFLGRRFEDGLLRGWLEYVGTFMQKFVLRKKTVLLSNVRTRPL